VPFALTLRANRDAAMALMADALKAPPPPSPLPPVLTGHVSANKEGEAPGLRTKCPHARTLARSHLCPRASAAPRGADGRARGRAGNFRAAGGGADPRGAWGARGGCVGSRGAAGARGRPRWGAAGSGPARRGHAGHWSHWATPAGLCQHGRPAADAGARPPCSRARFPPVPAAGPLELTRARRRRWRRCTTWTRTCAS
jgi:hypothetical protein